MLTVLVRRVRMAKLRKRKDGYYFVDYYVNGERHRKSCGKSRPLAKMKLKEVEALVLNNKHGYGYDHDITFDQLIADNERYFKTNTSHGTRDRYKAIINNFKSFIQINHPNVRVIQQFRAKLFEDYKAYRKDQGMAHNTINNEIGVLKSLFNRGIKWGYLKDNPLRYVDKLKIPKTVPPRFLRVAECDHIIAMADVWFKPILIAYLNTGMRKGELEHLMWEDIDMQRKRIMIRKKDGWNPKTNEREIPINDKMRPLLIKLRAASRNRGYVFTNKSGGKLSRNHIRNKLLITLKKAGISDVSKVHTLRHTFASHLAMDGVDMMTIKKIMGHADIATTMIYSHTTEQHLVDAVNKISF